VRRGVLRNKKKKRGYKPSTKNKESGKLGGRAPDTKVQGKERGKGLLRSRVDLTVPARKTADSRKKNLAKWKVIKEKNEQPVQDVRKKGKQKVLRDGGAIGVYEEKRGKGAKGGIKGLIPTRFRTG